MSDHGELDRAGVGPDVDSDVDEDDLVSVARIARPQGLRGEVIADLLTDFPERFAGLDRAYIKRADGQFFVLDLESSRPHKGRIALKFAGCDSIDSAEDLRNALVMVSRDQLIKLPEDTYYDFDLIGCEVIGADGQRLGRVEEVQDFGAAPLLLVRDDERELLIPLVLSICVEIDTGQKRIVVNPPEGLLDL
ncbi:MAG TPA: ribosome maturation factor RimM [Blastocatellia bacterium]|nr:ribosome maturation factor RimM [Blastocatellia bacterium]